MTVRPDLRRVTLLLTGLYCTIFIFMLIVHPGTEQFYTDFNNSYQILAPMFAAACGFAYAWRGRHSHQAGRVGWFLIGLAGLSFAIGQTTWTVYESVLRLEELPSPGPADIGYLGAYPLLVAGVVLLFGSMHIAGRARLLIDSMLASSSVAVLSWFFLVARLWDNPDVPLLGKLISVAYPLGDVAVLLCATVLWFGSAGNRTLRRSLGFLAAGIISLAFADTLYSYYNLHDAYQTGSWFDWAWSFGWVLMGYASLVPLWWPQSEVHVEQAQHPTNSLTNWLRILLPYLAVGAAFALVVHVDLEDDGTIQLHVFLTGVVLILLVISRQILTLIENQHLTGQLRTFNTTLEQLVVRRTEQLTALLHLTKGVNNTLRIELVTAAALNNVRQALHADVVTIHTIDEDGETSISQHVGLEDQPELVGVITAMPIRDQSELRSLPFNSASETAGNYLRAPLRWQQRVIGMIGVARRGSGFTETDSEMLESIGVEVGTAMENARLYAAAITAADTEPVTGLFNHRAVHQRLEDEFALAALHGRPLTVMMLDLDNFKRFNDTYGHPVGDQVLKTVAHILRSECRGSDIIGRYGGDEFIIVLPNTDTDAAYSVALRLRTAMASAGFRRGDDQRTVPVTVSLGIATYPHDCSNRHELLTIADANLYAAKQSEEGIRGTSDSQRTNRQLRTEGTFEVLDAMVTAVDNKDRYTRRHSEDVTDYALWLGEEMHFSEETMRIIRTGCLLHDVGKIGVPDDILRKPGRLTPEEYEIMKRHPRLGALIVGALPGMEAILDIVRSHHERWDGRGYPEELVGEDIPLLGRVAAIADAFSAMTTDRPYRKGLDWVEALEEIQTHTGTQFDPILAQAFIRAVRRRMRSSLATTVGPDMPSPSHRVIAHEYLQQANLRELQEEPVAMPPVKTRRAEDTRIPMQ